MDLKGKTILVTGGGSGIGSGIAVAFVREGCRVAIAGRNEERLRIAAESISGDPPIIYHACDISERAAVEKLFDWLKQRMGTPDILVNCAGVQVPNRQFDRLRPEDWDRLLAINATGAYNCIYEVLPGMRERKSGLIVNISSTAGKRASKLTGAAYNASKFAMTALGNSVCLEEWKNGIHVTNICPGEVNTPIMDQRPVPVPEERKAKMLLPEDIAAMVLAVAKLPHRALVPEIVITPLHQEYS